jgi:hypothetical protein
MNSNIHTLRVRWYKFVVWGKLNGSDIMSSSLSLLLLFVVVLSGGPLFGWRLSCVLYLPKCRRFRLGRLVANTNKVNRPFCYLDHTTIIHPARLVWVYYNTTPHSFRYEGYADFLINGRSLVLQKTLETRV